MESKTERCVRGAKLTQMMVITRSFVLLLCNRKPFQQQNHFLLFPFCFIPAFTFSWASHPPISHRSFKAMYTSPRRPFFFSSFYLFSARWRLFSSLGKSLGCWWWISVFKLAHTSVFLKWGLPLLASPRLLVGSLPRETAPTHTHTKKQNPILLLRRVILVVQRCKNFV